MSDIGSSDDRAVSKTPYQGASEMIRSEEVLAVSTTTVPYRRVRMQKVVVTGTQTFTVEVRREEVRLIEEPFDDTTPLPPDTDTSTDIPDVTMVLHEERVIITTGVVPTERVRLVCYTVTGEENVTADLRAEKITLDTTVPPRG